MAHPTFDYIIIGAGTAGCLLANRLSADSSKRVLLIEAGRGDNYHWIHIPVGYLYCIGNPRTDWLYKTEADQGLNGRQLGYPRGKVVGGCSSINGMIYMRGQARDYDQWAKTTGDDGWAWERCLPDFMAHEDHYLLDGGADAQDRDLAHFHGNHTLKHSGMSTGLGSAAQQTRSGFGGEWRVEKQRLSWDVLDAFAKAANQAGIPSTSDFNRGSNEGVGYFEVNQKSGFRWNAAKAFLRPQCAQRPNFELWTSSQVVKLLMEKDFEGRPRCIGVQLLRDKGMVNAMLGDSENAQVILSAGSIGSPQILQLSGIGSAELLKDRGIPLVIDAPGVGANLQDHLQIRAVYKVHGVKTLNTVANSWLGKLQIGMEYALKRTGPMSMSPSQLGAFTKSSPDQPYPNIQYHVQPLSLEAFGQPLHSFPAFTASVCNLNPSSRGTVNIKTNNFQDAPAIAPNYLSTLEDRKVAADSLRITRKIVSQPALAAYQPQEHKPGVEFQTDEALAKLAGDIATTIFHPVGTAKMGMKSDPMAVLNSHLRVHDGQGGLVRGLRVVDASAMPFITSGNTNSPTLMMAEKAARWIIQGD
jgi:choline dehydrogenase